MPRTRRYAGGRPTRRRPEPGQILTRSLGRGQVLWGKVLASFTHVLAGAYAVFSRRDIAGD
jgi:hypothetical protein